MSDQRRRLDRLEASVPPMSSAPSGYNGYGVCPFCGAPPCTPERPPCEHAPKWWEALDWYGNPVHADHDDDPGDFDAAVRDALAEAGADYDASTDAVVVSLDARIEAARLGLSTADSWALVQSRLNERRQRERRERAAAALDL